MKEDLCKGCPYEKDDSKIVKSLRLDKNILLVMQSPGKNENETGKPLSGTKGSSATQIIIKLLPSDKRIEDYAVAELVRCKPTKANYDKVALSICYRYLEKEISEHNFDKIICFCVDAKPIIDNILTRLGKSSINVIECPYPKNTLSKKAKEKIKKALE